MANAGTDARITWQHSSIIAFQSFHRTRDARRATIARHRLVVRGDRERRPPGRVHDMAHMAFHRITGPIAFHSRHLMRGEHGERRDGRVGEVEREQEGLDRLRAQDRAVLGRAQRAQLLDEARLRGVSERTCRIRSGPLNNEE